MKLLFSTSTFLALSAAGMTSASDSLRGASPTLDQEAPRLRALMGSCGAACDAINGASQYACEPHATMAGLSVCSFGVQTDSLTSDPASGAVFNRVQFQNVGASGPGSTMTTGGGGITSSNGGDSSTTGGAGCAVNGSPVIEAGNSGAVTTGQPMTGGTGSGSTFNGGTSTTSSTNGGFPTEEEQNTVGGSASDRPPAEGGNYDSQDTLPENTPQLCVTNAVSATCPAGTNTPDIACCASKVTGAFFNACCPSGFQGIQMGSGTNTNQFDMNMLMGTGVEAPADCVVNANRRGCQIFDVPGNPPNQEIVLPAGVSGPCEYVTAGTTCPAGYTSGTCTAAGNTAPVCCPPCATGTYLPGNACQVILPDPAACGFNIVGGTTTNDNTQQAAAGASGGTTGGSITSSNGGDSNTGGAGCAVVAQPSAVTVTVPRTFGSVPTGGACGGDNDCLQNHICINRNGGICATMGSCYNDGDCENPNNTGWTIAGCNGPMKCSGVTCQQDCSSGSSSTTTTTTTTTNTGINSGTGTANGLRPALNSEVLGCPAKENMPKEGDNCCAYIADNRIEASCLYTESGTQCDCAGQNNAMGESYCTTVGWNCRQSFNSGSFSSTNGVVNDNGNGGGITGTGGGAVNGGGGSCR